MTKANNSLDNIWKTWKRYPKKVVTRYIKLRTASTGFEEKPKRVMVND
jgi:hypothetical protein